MNPSPTQNIYSLFKQKSRSLVHHRWTGQIYTAQWIFKPSYRLSLRLPKNYTQNPCFLRYTMKLQLWSDPGIHNCVRVYKCVHVYLYEWIYICLGVSIFNFVYRYTTRSSSEYRRRGIIHFSSICKLWFNIPTNILGWLTNVFPRVVHIWIRKKSVQ